jgi:VanZ family protein
LCIHDEIAAHFAFPLDSAAFAAWQARKLISRLLPYGPAAVWAAVVLYIGSRPYLSLPQFNFPIDKVGHFGMYGILGALLAFGWVRASAPRTWLIPLAVALCIGAADELHQRVVPGRSSDLWDWVADATGAAGAFWVMTRVMRNDARRA